MLEVIPFNYNDIEVRALTVDGEAMFVASDIAKALEYREAKDMTRSLDPDEKDRHPVPTPGGLQQMTVISEAGLFRVILQRQSGRLQNKETKNRVKAFQRWVTHEVLPSIRKTGSYAVGQPVELTGPELMAKALIEANSTLQAQAQALLEAKPKVEAFEAFLSSNGDYSVGEAAKVLARDHQIVTGEKRLFSQLEAWGWIYRNAKGRPICKQSQIENGRLAHKARFYIDWKTGEQVMATPQVRVTAKGIEAIATKIKELMEVSA